MSIHERRVIVIGGGLGGISAAISLAADGFDVDLYEKNDKLGGKLNVLEKGGFRFDLGPSILMLPDTYRRVFAKAGRRLEDYVELQRVEPQWRSFFEDGTVADLYSDRVRMRGELRRLGADEREYERFLAWARRLQAATEKTYFAGAESVVDVLKRYGSAAILREVGLPRSVRSGVEHHVREPHLRDILSFFVKYVGSSAKDAPAVLNMMSHAQLEQGLWYVRGGLYNLARGLARVLDELGVRVHLGAEVARIRHEDGVVRGIELAGGGREDAAAVVSNMEVVPAYRRLLGESPRAVQRLERRYEPSASGLVLDLGLDRDYPQLAHHNFFFSRDMNEHLDAIHRRKELPEDPTLYVVYPTRSDPTVAPPGRHILKVLPHLPHLTDRPPTDADYARVKELVLDKLERMGLADLRRHIVLEHVLTPRDLERMYHSNRGSIYGVLSHRWRNLGFKAPRRDRKYRNLWFVGGSVNPGGGTPMVMLCGQLVGAEVAQALGGARPLEREQQEPRAGGSFSHTIAEGASSHA